MKFNQDGIQTGGFVTVLKCLFGGILVVANGPCFVLGLNQWGKGSCTLLNFCRSPLGGTSVKLAAYDMICCNFMIAKIF